MNDEDNCGCDYCQMDLICEKFLFLHQHAHTHASHAYGTSAQNARKRYSYKKISRMSEQCKHQQSPQQQRQQHHVANCRQTVKRQHLVCVSAFRFNENHKTKHRKSHFVLRSINRRTRAIQSSHLLHSPFVRFRFHWCNCGCQCQ